MPSKKTTTEETAVATLDETTTALAHPLDEVEWEDDGVNPDKVRPIYPSIKLIQGTTRGADMRDAGRFVHSDTGAVEDSIEVIPLHQTDQRSFFEDGNDTPACVSFDGIAPQPNQPLWAKPQILVKNQLIDQSGLWQPSLCADCPYSRFGDNDEAPLCNESILMMVRRDDESLAQFRIGRTGLSPVRREIGKLKGMAGRPPIFTRLWTFGSKTVEKGTKKWQQLVVTTTPLPTEDAIAINGIVKTMRSTIQREAQVSAMTGDEATIIDIEVPDYE